MTRLGLTRSLARRLAGVKQRRRGHDPGRVIRDLAVMLADGGECVSDLAAVRGQQALFEVVASDSTAFRVIDRIASEPGCWMRCARRMRDRFWRLHGAARPLTIDLDATLITAHSEKEGTAGNFKSGFRFHPLPKRSARRSSKARGCLGSGARPGWNRAPNGEVAEITDRLDLSSRCGSRS